MIKFLDKEGLSKLSQEIKKKLEEKANVSHNHTISEVTDLNIATTDTDGLMSSTDKTKLDSLENYDDTELATQVNTNTTNIATNTENIETNATNIATNAEKISVNATNIANKVDKVEGKDLSSNDYTDEEKEKLAGIEENANNYELPVATNEVLGGVKVGSNLNIEDGTLGADVGLEEIEALQTKISELEEENEACLSQIPSGTVSGNPIYIEDSSNLAFNWKLNGGSSQETSEESNNIFSIGEDEYTLYGVSVSIDKSTITMNGTTTSPGNFINSYNSSIAYRRHLGTIKAGTYNFKYFILSGTYTTTSAFAFYLRNSDGTAQGTISSNGTDNETFTLTEDTDLYLQGYFNATNMVFDNLVIGLDLIESETAQDEHEDYSVNMPSPDYPSEIKTVNNSVEIKVQNSTQDEEQTITMPIQQEMLEGDYIDDVEHHEWVKIEFNGTESLSDKMNSGWTQNSHVFGYSLRGVETNGQDTNVGTDVIKSTHFICKNTGYLVVNTENCISYYPAMHKIMFNFQDFTSIDEVKAYFAEQYEAGTPVTVYYKLATPEELELTAEQKEARNQVLKTYKNITNISVDNELATLDVTYKKDLETLISNL